MSKTCDEGSQVDVNKVKLIQAVSFSPLLHSHCRICLMKPSRYGNVQCSHLKATLCCDLLPLLLFLFI